MNRSSSECALEMYLQGLEAEDDVVEITEDQFQSAATSFKSAARAKEETTMLNLSNSELDLEKYLEEVMSRPSTSACGSDSSAARAEDECRTQSPPPAHATATFNEAAVPPIDSEEYRMYLRNRLNLTCAFVYSTQASLVKSQKSASAVAVSENDPQAYGTSKLGFQIPGQGYYLQSSKKTVASSTRSGSTREQLDGDEAQGEKETMQNLNPTDAKHLKRKLYNKVAARRHREKKQADLDEVKRKFSQLQDKHASLLKSQQDAKAMALKLVVQNTVLKADLQTSKEDLAKKIFKTLTELYPCLTDVPETSTMATNDCHMSTHISKSQNGFVNIPSADNVNLATVVAVDKNKMVRTASMERVASLEHLNKRIREEQPQLQ